MYLHRMPSLKMSHLLKNTGFVNILYTYSFFCHNILISTNIILTEFYGKHKTGKMTMY